MSLPTSLPKTLPTALMETVLNRLAALFLTGAAGDPNAARLAAAEMLAAYNPRTGVELRLAANIVAFGFQSLEALAQAAAPDMPLTRILRLRGGAVTLSRESAKAERRLAELQQARQDAAATTEPQPTERPPEPEPTPEPRTEKAIALIQDTAAIAATAEANNQTWTQAQQERQREARIAASLQRAEARVAALANAPAQPTPPQGNASTAHPPA